MSAVSSARNNNPARDEAQRGARALAQVLDAFSRNDGLPAVGDTLGRLAKMTESETEAVQDLANLVLADVALTQKLLKLANTVPYRMGPVPVTTVTRAIMLLGFDRVRATVMSVVLLDGLMGGKNAQRCRADFHHSLLAGALAREIIGQESDTAEEAAIAAMFRNLGRLLVAVYAPDEYQLVIKESPLLATQNGAARRLLGKSFDELTEAALSGWNLPDRIRVAVSPLPPRLPNPDSPTSWVRTAAQFAEEVSHALRAEGAKREELLAAALKRYGNVMSIDQPALVRAIERSVERTKALEEAFGMSRHDTAIADVVTPAGTVTRELPHEATLTSLSVVASSERDAVGRPANAREVLLAGLAEATESLTRETDLNSVVRIVVEAMYTGLGYARAAFLLRDPAANMYRTRASFGEPALKLAFSAQYTPDLFHAALSHATDLHIADIAAEKVAAKLPAWFVRELPHTKSFVLMPLMMGDKPLGLFFADRPMPDAQGLSSEELNLLRALRSQVVLAIKSR